MPSISLDKISPDSKIKDINLNLCSIIFIFNSNNQVLLQLRDNKPEILDPNIWGPLGGHCDINETPYDCAVRELYEESGYISKKLNWYGNYLFPYKNNMSHVVCTFWAIYDNKQKIHCNEGQKIVFLSIDELNNYTISKKNISIINQIKKVII